MKGQSLISKPFCALMLGLCLPLILVTGWLALTNAQHDHLGLAAVNLVSLVIQAGFAGLQISLLRR